MKQIYNVCLYDVLEALVDMVNQHCQVEFKNDQAYVSNMAISSNEDAFFVLENLKLITKSRKRGLYRVRWDNLEKFADKIKPINII